MKRWGREKGVSGYFILADNQDIKPHSIFFFKNVCPFGNYALIFAAAKGKNNGSEQAKHKTRK